MERLVWEPTIHVPWLGMVNLAPIKMVMTWGCFMALGESHIHKKNNVVPVISGYLCVYIYIYHYDYDY